MGCNEGNADYALSADGYDGRNEGMRRLSQARNKERGGNKAIEKGRCGIRSCLMRCLPYASYIFKGGSPATAGMSDVPHGLRPSAVGNVFRIEARCTLPFKTE